MPRRVRSPLQLCRRRAALLRPASVWLRMRERMWFVSLARVVIRDRIVRLLSIEGEKWRTGVTMEVSASVSASRHMAQPSSTRPITGDDIISELIRNVEAGAFKVRYTTLVPCIFNVYLHAEDFDQIRPIAGFVRSEAK